MFIFLILLVGFDLNLRQSGFTDGRVELNLVHSFIDRSKLDGAVTGRINGVDVHG